MLTTNRMHAIVRRKYGSPDVLAYEEIDRPVPGDEDVLVRVHAAAASIGDCIIVSGKPYLIRLTRFGGVPRPRNPVPGACMAGGLLAMRLTSLFTRQTLRSLFTTPNRNDLLFLKGLVQDGQLKPVIERRYALSKVADALRHVGGRHSQGQTVIQIDGPQ